MNTIKCLPSQFWHWYKEMGTTLKKVEEKPFSQEGTFYIFSSRDNTEMFFGSGLDHGQINEPEFMCKNGKMTFMSTVFTGTVTDFYEGHDDEMPYHRKREITLVVLEIITIKGRFSNRLPYLNSETSQYISF